MGFRSTFVSSYECHVAWPDWFRAKYGQWITFPPPDEPGSCIASKFELKLYMEPFCDLAGDIQKAVNWDAPYPKDVLLVFLHECGGITRCEIRRDSIQWTEPTGWRHTFDGGVDHDYCYGCSDARKAKPALD